MKNLLYLAAIAATAVGFTSCSSEEDLNNAAKDSGVPFKVTASAPTRATDVTDANFANFKLYAFEGTDKWITGAQYTKSSSWAPANINEQYNWPHADVNSNFYAVSENDANTSITNFSEDIKNTQSLNYTVPTTIADQKDLLIAYASSNSKDAHVALPFKHALAAAKLYFTIDPSITSMTGDLYPTYRLRAEIRSMTIHNVYTTGKCKITDNSWTELSNLGSYTITFATPIVVDTKTTDIKKEVEVNLGENGTIMFIPQTIDYWDIKPNVTSAATLATGSPDKSYISFEAQTMAYDATGDGVNDGLGVKTALEEYITNGTKNTDGKAFVTKGKDGNYYDANAKEIATSEGEIKDLASTVFQEAYFKNPTKYISQSIDVQWITFTDGLSTDPSNYFNQHDYAGYGTLLKPLCLGSYSVNGSGELVEQYNPLTFSSKKNHTLKLELSVALNKTKADGAFGAVAPAGAKRK